MKSIKGTIEHLANIWQLEDSNNCSPQKFLMTSSAAPLTPLSSYKFPAETIKRHRINSDLLRAGNEKGLKRSNKVEKIHIRDPYYTSKNTVKC